MPAFEGGNPTPVTTGGSGQVEQRRALPVAVVSGQAPAGGRARRVVVVTSGPVEGGSPHPVYDAGGSALYTDEPALPVYVVSGSLGGAAAFTPSQISGLVADWNPAALALNDGDAINSLTDTYGGYHATGTTTQRPTFKTNILNGYPVARFNGTANGLVTPSIDLTGTSAVTVFVVASCGSTGDRAIVEAGPNTSSNTTGFLLYRQTTSLKVTAYTKGDVGNSTLTSDATMTSSTAFRVLSARFDKSLATNEAIAFVNGSWGGAYVGVNNTNAYGNVPIYIGARAQASLFLSGDIARILLYNRALTATQRQQVEDYLNTLYGTLFFRAGATNLKDTTAVTTAADAFVGDLYPVHSPLARMVFTTSATSIDIGTFNNLNGDYPNFTEIGIRSNGADHTTLQAGASGEKILSTTLPAGTNKTIEVVAGLQSKPIATLEGTYLKSVSFPGSMATLASVSATPRLTIYGDSIAVGANATSTPLDAWGAKLRADYTSVLIEGFGFRNLYDDANTSGLRAALVATIAATAPTLIWLAIGTNDYGLNKWSAASFGTAYAALLDDLHTALPAAIIYCQTPLTRFSPAAETANGSGSTLGNYRTQIATAQGARSSYCTLVDGTAIITSSGDMDTDGIHPTTAGHATYYAAVKTALGI